MLQKLNTTQKK